MSLITVEVPDKPYLVYCGAGVWEILMHEIVRGIICVNDAGFFVLSIGEHHRGYKTLDESRGVGLSMIAGKNLAARKQAKR